MKVGLVAATCLLVAGLAMGRSSGLMSGEVLQAIIDESSGELALRYFAELLAYSGYAPSLGAEQTAEALARRARSFGLRPVTVEHFPSDGRRFVWAFRTEPWWEGRSGELWMVEPERRRLASFRVYRGHLARYSTSTQARAELVDVGRGTEPSDYEAKDVEGKIVLASGPLGRVHGRAVWERKASGVVVYRPKDCLQHPDLVHAASIEPFEGPRGESPAFAFSLSCRMGASLAERLREKRPIVLEADVEAETRAGDYPQVHAIIEGTEPGSGEVWILAHTNHRNTGGGNNLTGVGATLEVARTLSTLIARGRIARPRRSLRFVWGAEHIATLYTFHEHPEAAGSILALLNLDMVGDHQVLSESILRLYRTPASRPSFVNDVVEEMFETVAEGNSYSLVTGRLLDLESKFTLPIVEPSGSRDPFYYKIEPFWGPSDHEDVVEASLGVPAVLLNTWPDPYIGTQEDTVERADATQMKRAIVITAASALLLASAGPETVPALAQNALARARARIAREEVRAAELVASAGPSTGGERYREAANIIHQAYRVEAEALRSLEVFATEEVSRGVVAAAVTGIAGAEPLARERLRRHAEALARFRGARPPGRDASGPRGGPDEAAAGLVPVRTGRVRGPVNFFRAQYGRDWMIRRLGDPRFLEKIRLARLGHYYLYETLSFADGRRTLKAIRDAVAAEYVPAPLDEILEYFRLLEKAGVVTLGRP